jgi:serine O-acetyltransferase
MTRQLNSFFPDKLYSKNISNVVKDAFLKTQANFQNIALAHYHLDGKLFFNHLNSDQYTVFLYYASYIAYEKYKDENLATKLFYLNKVLHQFHCMYNTKLPDIFVLIHGTGIVLGKAKYSNFLVLSQHCNVGANDKLEYPELSEKVIMYPNSSILGKSFIGENSCISNGAFVNNENIEENSLIFGRSPNLVKKNDKKERFAYFFKFSGSEK